ncbi:VOC family protein [Fictibacillus sp. NRS-1165]|uniref:VOC family protein n=1 Tax=Fictibacillus sp. NRS-1165 TaxID=3144463 RepID=UPI003D216A9A
MALAFDHLVYFTDKALNNHIDSLKKQGIHAVRGGSHKDWGTYNTLSYFGLTYVEFLAVEKEEIARKATQNPLIGQLMQSFPEKQGPGQFAIRTDRIDHLKILLEQKGLETRLFPGSRKREDGSTLNWKLLFITSNDKGNKLSPPFFIDWLEPDMERDTDLREKGFIGKHPAGDLRMDHLKIIVEDAEKTSLTWQGWLGLSKGRSYIDNDLQAECTVLELDGCRLHFCSPLGEGPAQDLLRERGERPYELVLSNGLNLK